ncbi:MAG: response regulator, partial [Acidobacteriota bacterium]
FSAISSALLATTFLYVWYAYVRRPHVVLWSCAWWAAVGHLMSGWWSVQHGGSTGNWAVQQVFLVTNATLMLAGCWAFTRGRRAFVPAVALATPFLVWVALAPRLSLSFTQVELPGALLLAAAYGLTSYRFWRLRQQEGTSGATIVAILFGLAAVHELDYPLLRQIEGFAPIGYAIAASLAAAIALFLLVMILEQARAAAETALGERETMAQRLHELVENLDREVMQRTEALATATLEAQGANRAKSEFLSRMSHEIRTPLNGIIGVIELIERKTLDDEGRELVDIVRRSAATLLDVVGKVLDFSKIEAGKVELEAIAFSPEELCRDVAELLAESARRQGLELTVDLPPSLPERLIGDPTRLRQILVNLTSNAVKFTEEGRVVLRAGYDAGKRAGNDAGKRAGNDAGERAGNDAGERAGNDAGVLRLAVEDTGIGLSEAARSRIFEAFAQADSSTTRRFGGTGLGLAIVQRLVEQMEGELGVDSEEGVGSTFWLEVAAAVDVTEAPRDPLDRTPRTAPQAAVVRGSGRRILLAEDNRINAIVASRMLEQLGAEVVIAADGVEAVAAAAEGRFDLIFLDCEMPKMDGYAAAGEIRRDRLNRVTPLVALTAHASDRDRERCLAAGMDDFVAKPLTFPAIEQVLDRWLDRLAARP